VPLPRPLALVVVNPVFPLATPEVYSRVRPVDFSAGGRVRALVAALLEAGRWIDASDANRSRMAEVIAREPYVNVPVEVILDRILGRYQDGMGRTWTDAHAMRFHADGAVNFPWLSDGMWFLTQFKRWGLVREAPDYAAVAARVNRVDLYAQAAAQVKVAVPAQPMRASRLMDGIVWDGTAPERYAAAHHIHA